MRITLFFALLLAGHVIAADMVLGPPGKPMVLGPPGPPMVLKSGGTPMVMLAPTRTMVIIPPTAATPQMLTIQAAPMQSFPGLNLTILPLAIPQDKM